jgi:hypothetical protein
MKKIYLLMILVAGYFSTNAQNLQLHYDMGEDRGYMTTTLEMFKPDKWGSTFYFVDFDYNKDAGNTVSFAYMEIARGLKFWDSPWEIHVEYNGGTYVNDAWLFGANYTWNNSDFTRIFTLQGMYKNIKNTDDASFQITGVWTIHMADRKLTFSGFADFWKERIPFADGETDFVFLSEPQLWYNATEHLSLGGEIELASNFAGHKGFKACPTLGVKWNF